MKLYTQRSIKDGRLEMNLGWTEGVSSYDREKVIDNIMATVGDDMTEDEYNEAREQLAAGHRLHIDTVTYDILESEE